MGDYSLKWNDFHGVLRSGFHDLLATSTMVDVTLACEGQIMQAHKVILSICSSYFSSVFQANQCQHPVIIMKDFKYSTLQLLLTFMYQGEVQVKHEDLASFLNMAEALVIKGLCSNKQKKDNKEQEKTPDHDDDKSVYMTPPMMNTIPSHNDETNVTPHKKNASDSCFTTSTPKAKKSQAIIFGNKPDIQNIKVQNIQQQPSKVVVEEIVTFTPVKNKIAEIMKQPIQYQSLSEIKNSIENYDMLASPSTNKDQHKELAKLTASYQQKLTAPSTNHQQEITEPSMSYQQEITELSTSCQQEITEPSTIYQQEMTAPSISHQQKITAPSTSHQQEMTAPSISQQKITAPSTSRQQEISELNQNLIENGIPASVQFNLAKIEALNGRGGQFFNEETASSVVNSADLNWDSDSEGEMNDFSTKVVAVLGSGEVAADEIIPPISAGHGHLTGAQFGAANSQDIDMESQDEKEESPRRKLFKALALVPSDNNSMPMSPYHQCKFCTKRYLKRSSLLNHVRNIHGDASRAMTCRDCNKQFKHKMSLQGHMWRYHKRTSPKLKTESPKKHNNTPMKKEILKIRTPFIQKSPQVVDFPSFEDNSFICNECGQNLISKMNLVRHMTKFHSKKKPSNDQIDVKVCMFCAESFTTKYELLEHVMKVHNPM